MAILVTGAAGFIGFHTAKALLERGDRVIGMDNLNEYYSVSLKQSRLAELSGDSAFSFLQADVSDRDAVNAAIRAHRITDIVHLAAQAGVRHSLRDPYAYVTANVMGQVVMLEAARRIEGLRHFVYASSSSVYGANGKLPFSVEDPVETPVSLYAATKRSDELITYSYSHTHRLPATGLRFFTVYGPWGRPDMAAYLFCDAITAGRPIRIFNGGLMQRDFTYVDDIVEGVLAALDRPPSTEANQAPHRIYNLGSHRAESLMRFVGLIETALGRKAKIVREPMQPGDVEATYADIEASRRDLGFDPKTPIEVGIPNFVDWYKSYHGIS